jgi:predicted nucleic acid-binding protein
VSRYLLDTDVIVDWLKGVRTSVETLLELYAHGHALCTCSVVIAEVYSGLGADVMERGERLLNALHYLSTSPVAAKQAGVWRYTFASQGRTLAVTDSLIAATAHEHQASVVTGNVRDYPMREIEVIPLPRRRQPT